MSKTTMVTVLLLVFALVVDVFVIVSQGFNLFALIFAVIALISLIGIFTGKIQ